MCILCVVQKWSRRVATMLPWLVIPLIVLWALSQLLPPGFRFEVTSPRLACVFVLLVTLFWYEVLMPQLSAWRVRRSAWLREQQRLEAMELEKLRKTATRRCRNCLTPYRDQNPGGGRFMCSYCGHTSRRPVLDMPVPPNLGITGSGIGKILNGKVWSENGWICSQDWSENGNWVGGSLVGKSGGQWGRNGGAFFSGDDRCSAEKSYSGVFVFACKLLASFFLSIRWLWRKIFRVGSASEDGSSEAEHKGLSKKGDNGTNLNESRGEKARRKAEEKRQARLEREMLEEEERKQREEVARLVKERRRLRDEKLEAEKERGKGSTPDRERDSRRETERRRQEKRKEKDKGSSKSNSDGEEVERKANRESERKREFDKRSEIERRDFQKVGVESIRAQSFEMGNGIKGISSNFNRPNGGGSRYFDRMKGSFLSSSKAFNGAAFFGRGAHTSNTITKLTKPSGSVDYFQTSGSRREALAPENITGKFTLNGDDKVSETASHRPVVSDMQPKPATPKKTWQQLFTRSSAGSSSSDANAISRPNSNHQTEAWNPQFDQAPQAYNLSNPIQFAFPLPFTPLCTAPMNSSIAPAAAGSALPLIGNPAHDFASEDAELFEDPCYEPDPVSLLGPVSESLDNFPLDLGTGFVTGTGLERHHVLKNVSASTEVNKPSPIESPMSRSRVAEEKHVTSGQLPCTLGSRDMRTSLDESGDAHEQGTWQMWGSPPLGQDGLGLVGGPASWLLPLGQNMSNHEDIVHPSVHKAVTSHVPNENQVIPGSSSPQKICVGNGHSGGTFSPLSSSSNDNDPWLQKTVFQSLSGDGEKHFPPLHPREDRMTYDGRSKTGSGHSFEQSPANCWSKRDWAAHGQGEGEGNSTLAMPPIGGLFSTPDVQSLWSFN